MLVPSNENGSNYACMMKTCNLPIHVSRQNIMNHSCLTGKLSGSFIKWLSSASTVFREVHYLLCILISQHALDHALLHYPFSATFYPRYMHALVMKFALIVYMYFFPNYNWIGLSIWNYVRIDEIKNIFSSHWHT